MLLMNAHLPNIFFWTNLLNWNYTLITKMCWTQNIIDSLIFFFFFVSLLRTKNKAHHFILLLTWVMSKLWTYLLLQVTNTFLITFFCTSVPYLLYIQYTHSTSSYYYNESTRVQKRNVPLFVLQVPKSMLRTRDCWLLYIGQLPHKMKYVPILKQRRRWIFFST